jgi:Aminotransferase class I and II
LYGIIVIVDEAYWNYIDISQSACTLLSRFPNLIVIRSNGKGLWIGSMRIGVMLFGCEYVVKAYQRVHSPMCPDLLSEELDVDACGLRLEYLLPARRNFEISTPCTIEQPGLAKISFSPMHSIGEIVCLPDGSNSARPSGVRPSSLASFSTTSLMWISPIKGQRLMLKSAKRASLVENLRSLRGLDKVRVR